MATTEICNVISFAITVNVIVFLMPLMSYERLGY